MSQNPENFDDFCAEYDRQEAERDTFELRSLAPIGHPRFAISNTGEVWNIPKNKRIKQGISITGYPRVAMDGNQFAVHRLVAQAFVPNPNPEEFDIVDHIDCDPGNPNADNLRWTNTRGNLDHQVQVGSLPPRIPDNVVHEICQELTAGVGCTEIARKYNVSYDAVYQIKRGANWTHISEQYDVKKPKTRNPMLTETQVIEICHLLNNTNLTHKRIGEMYGTSRATIDKIASGTNWRKITAQYLKPQTQSSPSPGENPGSSK